MGEATSQRTPRPRPVVVVSGLPRSGTSLAMQMLRAGGLPVLSDARRPADAGNPRGYWELEAVKRLPRDAEWLERAEGRAVKVVHARVAALPAGREYRVIWMERDPLEVARSQRALLAHLDEPPPEADDALVAELLGRQLDAAARALDARPGFERLVVRHAALIAQPRREARRMADFVGDAAPDGLDVEAMARAVDPSLHRVRRLGP